ncbi:MAG TPA: prolyl oligopeptidase family serine peptidase [Gemmatimonadaceae bacterium]|nr:prolyl oligopeptidase family serine peptidase [Gemmatimonadaceae bacterium]
MLISPRASRILVAALSVTLAAPIVAQDKPTIAQFMSPSSPLELATARKADRVAWATYDRGMRNVYTAAAPSFTPVRLTSFLNDNGIDVGNVSLSDDGSIAVFVRGHAPNRSGWVANPMHDPAGSERAIWAVRTSGGGEAWRVAEGGSPELSPDGRWVLFVKDGQIHRARVLPGATTAVDSGTKAFITAWGSQSSPQWSPDGAKIAFVSNRQNHSFIGIYDVQTRTIDYLSPSVDCDASPTWSPDGKRIAFVRRPGVPFGRQTQRGAGGIGNPPGPAVGGGGGGCGGGGFGGFGQNVQQQDSSARGVRMPGMYSATLDGGATLAIYTADVTNCPVAGDRKTGGCPAAMLWHNDKGDRTFAAISRMMWADDHLVFPLSPQTDEWDRYYSLRISRPQAVPVMLTTTDGLIEGANSARLSPDGKTLFYSTNATDIERRHVWSVSVAGGTPARISAGSGIETHPRPLSSGSRLAVLSFDVAQPASVALVAATGGSPRVIYPTLGADFPVAAHVTPQIVKITAADGMVTSNQLFLPKDLRPGERRPAMVFVHGGPSRQMLPGYHYMQFYHWSYAYNQWLASQGYVVLSVNFRRGIGYGRSFQRADSTNRQGNAEYRDVLAAGRYLQERADVDPSRIGIWGLSYGGLLTAQALARNSDLFVAGADLAGVHLYDNVLDTAAMSYRSSAVSAMSTWKSPVFLVHGDDDRNVDFAQTVGLVQLLRAHEVPYELIVVPDEPHESLLHSRWIDTWEQIGDFLHRYVWERQAVVGGGSRE